MWSVRVTDGHSQNFQLWKPVKISDQMWLIVLWFILEGITKSSENQYNFVAMVIHLHENNFALTSRYSFAIHILTPWSCLVLLIVNVSQINWLSCQIFGISKQAQHFVRDGKTACPRWKVSEKCNLFNTPPHENGLVQDLLRLVTIDGFHGSVSLLVDFMIKYICFTDGRNANP